MSRYALLLPLLLGAALGRPAPPSDQQQFEDLVQSSLLKLASMRKEISSPKVERSTIESFINNVNGGPDVKPAKLFGTAQVTDDQPFTFENAAAPFTLPGFEGALSEDDQAILFELLQPTKVIRNHQSINEGSVQNIGENRKKSTTPLGVGVPLPTQQTSNSVVKNSGLPPKFSIDNIGTFGVPIPLADAQHTSSSFATNSDKSPTLSIDNIGTFGVPIPLTDAQHTSNSFATNSDKSPTFSIDNIGSFGVPLPMTDALGNSRGASGGASNPSVGVPLPSPPQNQFANNLAFGVPLAATNQEVPTNSIANAGAPAGVPLPSVHNVSPKTATGSNNNFGVPLPSTPTQGNQKDSVTVGDLVQNLNGVNGIKVISLNDLQNTGLSSSSSNGDILQQLRNAMISGNINEGGAQGVGVALPSLTLHQNIDQVENLGTEQEVNLGRQSDVAGGTVEGGSIIDSLFPDLESNAGATSGGADEEIDPFADINPLLDDNDDFAYEYDDDYDPLPAQPPNVFRSKLSDIFFTKGQWIGTLIGGAIDVGSSISSGVSKLFNKGSDEITTDDVSE